MQPCILIVCVCVVVGEGGITVLCAMPDIYLEKLLSCACVQVCTSAYALLNTLQECGRAVAYMYTCLLCACVV